MALAYVSRKVRQGYFYFMAKRVIDYAFKSKVLNEHYELLNQAKKASLYTYAIDELESNGVLMHCLRHSNGDNLTLSDLYLKSVDNGLKNEFLECLKINKASYERTNRLKKRIYDMLVNGDCLFLTLTFTDDTLSNSNSETRRKYVTKYLKMFNCPYVANIDFGKENHREHYHAIINTNNIDLSLWRKYGNINVERVRNRNIKNDNERLSKYICKLSNHAIKETTKRNSLIYSR